MPIKKVLFSVVLLLGLAGCSTSYRTEVVRFHDLTPQQGATVVVQPGQGVVDGPEFRQYADMVINKLAGQGFVAASDAEPDFIVNVSYGVIRQESRYRNSPWRTSVYFGYGSYRHPFYPYGYYHPYFFGSYWDYPDQFANLPEHERILEVVIKKPDEAVVFEGRAVSVGRTSMLVKVMPYLVESLFKNFPGQSGEVINVSIKEEELGTTP